MLLLTTGMIDARWSPATPVHVTHVDDITNGLWECAKWIEKVGRAKADEIAGEEIWFAHDKAKVREVEGTVDPSVVIKAPFFNLVSALTRCLWTLSQISFLG